METKAKAYSKHVLQLIVDSTDHAVIITDTKGKTLWVNDNFTLLTGYKAKEVVGKKPGRILQGEGTDKSVKAQIGEALSKKKPFEGEILNYKPNGKEYWIKLSIQPIDDYKGQPGFIGVSRDISDKKQAKQELSSRREMFKLLTEHSQELIALHDMEGTYEYVSPSFTHLLGYTQDELIGRSAYELFHPDDIIRIQQQSDEYSKQLSSIPSIEMRIRKKDGSYVWMESTTTVIFDQDGQPSKLRTSAVDISTRKQLTESLEFQSALLENVRESVLAVDMDGLITYWNKGAELIYGLSAEEMLGKSITVLDSNFTVKDFMKRFNAQTESALKRDWQYTRPDGRIIWVEARARPLKDKEDKVIGILGVAREITETKRNRTLLELTNNIANVGGWEIQAGNQQIYFTDETYRIYGLPIGTPLTVAESLDYYHPEDKKMVIEEVTKSIERNIPFDLRARFIDAEGKLKWVRLKGGTTFEGEEAKLTYGILHDIHEQKEREDQLIRSIERFRILSESSPMGVFMADAEGNCIWVNPKLQEIAGFTYKEAMGYGFANFIHPEDREKVLKVYKMRRQTGFELPITYRFIHKDGTLRHVQSVAARVNDNEGNFINMVGCIMDQTELVKSNEQLKESVRRMEDLQKAIDVGTIVAFTDHRGIITHANDRFCEISGYLCEDLVGKTHRIVNSGHHDKSFFTEMWKTIKAGNVWRGEIKNKAKDGSYYWVDTTIIPFKNKQEEVYQYVALRNDITEKKGIQLRLKRLNEELEQKVKERTQELEEINQELEAFNLMVSHDLKTPLRSAHIFAQMLQRTIEDYPKEQQQYIQNINHSLEEGFEIIEELLELGRLHRENIEKKPTNIKPLIYAYFKDMQQIHELPDAQLNTEELPKLNIDIRLFDHVINNLVGNAFKYHNPKKTLHIEVSYTQTDDWVELEFKDNGMGFKAEFAERIFEPFKRLVSRSHSRGTGLGLAICKRVVERHGGKIWAKSAEGKGAIFYIRLNKQE